MLIRALPVHLVEQEEELGGNARSLLATWQGESIADNLKEMIAKVADHELIDVHVETSIKDGTGFIGNFETTVTKNGTDSVLKHGAIVMATGATEYVPTEYLYGQDDRVLTHLGLDKAIGENDKRVADAKCGGLYPVCWFTGRSTTLLLKGLLHPLCQGGHRL